MSEGTPVKRNYCNVCNRPNPAGQTVCKHCGGTCELKVVGFFKADDEQETPEVKVDAVFIGSGKRIIGL